MKDYRQNRDEPMAGVAEGISPERIVRTAAASIGILAMLAGLGLAILAYSHIWSKVSGAGELEKTMHAWYDASKKAEDRVAGEKSELVDHRYPAIIFGALGWLILAWVPLKIMTSGARVAGWLTTDPARGQAGRNGP